MLDNIKQQPGFCYEFFKNQAFWSYKNTIGYNPCSFFKGFIVTGVNPKEAWYGPEHKALIEKISNGELIDGCRACYQAERNGLTSRRQSSRELYENFYNDTDITENSPVGLDYSVGNLCNLKCTICNPENSSKWVEDWSQLYPNADVTDYLYRKNQYVEITDIKHLSKIRNVHFHGGGDPFLSDSHIRLLENIKKSKGLSDVRVFYNVNGTNQIDPAVLELWGECRLVEIYFSIDDIGDRFEYQRTGASWDHTVKTMMWYRNNLPVNHMLYINCTWGYLNLFYLDELYDWYVSHFNSNRLGDPVNLIFQKCNGDYQIDHLSLNSMNILRTKFKNRPELQNLLNMLEVSDKSHSVFWAKIKRLDKIRNTNFKELCPEWSELL